MTLDELLNKFPDYIRVDICTPIMRPTGDIKTIRKNISETLLKSEVFNWKVINNPNSLFRDSFVTLQIDM